MKKNILAAFLAIVLLMTMFGGSIAAAYSQNTNVSTVFNNTTKVNFDKASREAPSASPSETPVPSPSETPVPSPSETPSETPVPSPSETPSETPMPSPSETPSETPVPSPSGTPSETPVPSPSGTPSETPVPSPSETPSATPSAPPSSNVFTYNDVLTLFKELPELSTITQNGTSKHETEILEKISFAYIAFYSLSNEEQERFKKEQPELLKSARALSNAAFGYTNSANPTTLNDATITSNYGNYPIAGVFLDNGTETVIYDNHTMAYVWELVTQFAKSGRSMGLKLYSTWYPSSYISVPAKTTIRLDLNGFSIDRRAISASRSGMVFYVEEGAVFEIDDTSKDKNGRITGGYGSGYGGGVHILSDAKVTLKNGSISGNKSTNGGGGVQIAGNANSKFIMTGGSVKINEAVGAYGGGIYIYEGTAQITGGSISSNQADYGGGVYVANNQVNYTFLLNGGSVSSNQAKYDGGGIYVNKGSVGIHTGHLEYNTADNDGGGIFVNRATSSYINAFYVLRAIFTGNTARNGNGGGIYFSNIGANRARIYGGTFTRNHAKKDGGGIYASAGSDISLGGTYGGTSYMAALTVENNSPSNLFLPRDSKLYSIEPLEKDSKIGIYTADIPSGKELDLTTQQIKETLPLLKFYSERSSYEVRVGNSGKLALTYKQSSGSEPTSYNGYPLQKGIYSFTTTVGNSDKTATYYYSDGYFLSGPESSGSATEYNSHLATMSYNLAMSAFGASSDYSQKYQYADKLLNNIGFQKIKYNKAFTEKPTKDSIGVIMGHKKMKNNVPVIAIAIRGGGYESEWSSNVTLGEFGEAKGFESAATQVMSFVDDYVRENNLERGRGYMKFWVVGFSRSGAVANIVANRLYKWTPPLNTYAYCFEPPQAGHVSDSLYKTAQHNIHNIVNPSDIVPRVAPVTMGFYRYGKTISIPHEEVGTAGYNERKLRMLAQLGAVNQNVIFGDKFEEASINYIMGAGLGASNLTSATGNKILFSTFIDNFFDKFVEWTVANRANYTKQIWGGSITIEQALANVAPLPFTIPQERQAKIMKCASGIAARLSKSQFFVLYERIIRWRDSIFIGEATRKEVIAQITTLVLKNTNDELSNHKTNPLKYPLPDVIGNHLTTEEYKAVEASLPTLIDFMFTFLSKDYWITDQHYLGSLLHNQDILVQPHYPEVVLAWLRTYDSFYNNYSSYKPAEEINRSAPSAPTSTLPNYFTYATSQTTILQCVDPYATIFYTLDGTDPKTSATRQIYSTDPANNKLHLLAKDKEASYTIKAVARNYNLYSSVSTYIYNFNPIKYTLYINDIAKKTATMDANILINAPVFNDKSFTNWTLYKQDGTLFSTINESITRFKMPAHDVYAVPNYIEKISQVDIQISTPNDLNTKRDSYAAWRYKIGDEYHSSDSWKGDAKTKVSKNASVNWVGDRGSFTAVITLLPDANKSWTFGDNVKVVVNETLDAKIEYNLDGSLTVRTKFTPRTIENKNVNIGSRFVFVGTKAENLPLPQTILVDATFGSKPENICKRWVNVTWDTSSYESLPGIGNVTLYGTLDFATANIDVLPGHMVRAETSIYVQPHFTADPPFASPNSGTYDKDQSISLTSYPNAKIYYTTDGTDPTSASTLYTAPIEVKGNGEGTITTTTIKSIAVTDSNTVTDPADPNYGKEVTSKIASYTYIIDIPKELYSVKVECFDTNPLVNDVSETTINYYYPGEPVYLTAPEGFFIDYVNWDVSKGNESAAKDAIKLDPTQRTVMFVMENKNIELTANYISIANKLSVQIDAPVAGENLPMEAKNYTVEMCNLDPYSVPLEHVSVAWNQTDSVAAYDQEYSAVITIPSAVPDKYTFVLAKDEPIAVSVNGEIIPTENLSFENGNVIISHTFPKTKLPKLLNILTPKSSGVLPNGTALEDISLPQTVMIEVEGIGLQSAPVSWEMTAAHPYDPTKLEQQSFVMKGNVTIPEEIAVSNSSTDISGSDTVATSVVTTYIVDVSEAKTAVSPPVASPASGTYNEPMSIILGCSTSGADIYYTLDGSSPDTFGMLYDSPIQLPQYDDTDGVYNLKVIALKGDTNKSEIATFNYTISAKNKKTITITSPTENTVVNVSDGDTANLSVVAQGDIGAYQWETNNGSGFTSIVDATNADYTTPVLTTADDGREYRCVVVNKNGIGATSHLFIIKVDSQDLSKPASKSKKTEKEIKKTDPQILQPTEDVTVNVAIGEIASLAISASNAVSYQWEIDRGNGFSLIPDAKEATYKTSAVTAQENGYRYRCTVTGEKNTTPATSPVFTVKLLEATPETPSEFKILSPTQDTSIVLNEGETATLSVTATGATGYQWQKAKGIMFENIEGATDSSFEISPFTAADDGSRYVCMVTGTEGATLTSPIFTIRQTPDTAPANASNIPLIIALSVGGAAGLGAIATFIIRKRIKLK